MLVWLAALGPLISRLDLPTFIEPLLCVINVFPIRKQCFIKTRIHFSIINSQEKEQMWRYEESIKLHRGFLFVERSCDQPKGITAQAFKLCLHWNYELKILTPRFDYTNYHFEIKLLSFALWDTQIKLLFLLFLIFHASYLNRIQSNRKSYESL